MWCLSRTKNNRGMTLAEMLVVLILIGLLSGGVAVIGTSGVRMANREAFDAECEALKDALNDARDRALMQDANRDVIVDIYNDGYAIKTWDDQKEKFYSERVSFEKIQASSANGPIDPNYHYLVRFLAEGTINKGQTIRLTGPGQLKRNLVLQPVTGRIWLSD